MKKQKNYELEYDLKEALEVLLRRKKIVIWGTLIFTSVSIIISFLIPKTYRSDGFYVFSSGEVQRKKTEEMDLQTIGSEQEDEEQMSLPDYKKYFSIFSNVERFIKYIKKKKQLNIEEQKRISQLIAGPGDLNKRIEPVYAFSKVDFNNFGQISKDFKNYIIGIKLSFESLDPNEARKNIVILSDFIKGCIAYSKIYEYITGEYNRAKINIRKYDNLILKTNFEIEKVLKKRDNFREILKRLPESRSSEQRELVSTEKGGYRYLSPIAQLIGTESHLVDLKSYLDEYIRQRAFFSLKFDFFDRAREKIIDNHKGIELFEAVIQLKDEFFNNLDLEKSVDKEIYNEINMELDRYYHLFYEIMRFVSGPSLPAKSIRPKKLPMILVSFLLSFILFVFFAFLIEWWKKNIRNNRLKKK